MFRLKGYILLGDESLLYRFNKHYDAITKYMSLNSNDGFEHGDGSCLKTVHMHMPNRQARNYIDALLAFWPGLQVLKGDIKGAIKMHEALHQIVQKHDFLPEAVLFDHSIHWSNHPLRPEFLESTYYLYRATKDNHYLEIAKKMVEMLEKHSRVACGYAAIADLKTKRHEDRMDSFVYAETFKYLYLMFAEEDEMLFDMNEFIFSTEAHLLPLHLNDYAHNKTGPRRRAELLIDQEAPTWRGKSCPSFEFLFDSKKQSVPQMAQRLRESVAQVNERRCYQQQTQSATFTFQSNIDKVKQMPLRAVEFVAGKKEHVDILKVMGIKITSTPDGRVQLVHKTEEAETLDDAEKGILFMTEMLELSKKQNFQIKSSLLEDYRPLSVVLVSSPFDAKLEFTAGPAQFGPDLKLNLGVFGELAVSQPMDACDLIENRQQIHNKIAVAKRGNCMFVQKARIAEASGAIGLVIIDNQNGTSHSSSPLFAMSGDGVQNVAIPSVFLFGKEGTELIELLEKNKKIIAFIGDNLAKDKLNGVERALAFNPQQLKNILLSKPDEMFSLKMSNRFSRANFSRSKEKIDVCLADDYQLLKHYFDLYTPISEPDEEEIQVMILDDVIELSIGSDDNPELIIRFDVLLNDSRLVEMKPTLSSHEFTSKVYEFLSSRFEANTNLISLINKEAYLKSLFNLVDAELNKSQLETRDHESLDQLAHEIDFKDNSSVTVKTVKRTKKIKTK